MKKTLFILAIIFALVSCSNDENENSNDEIVGRWSLFSISKKEVTDCEKKTTIDFRSNGVTITETFQTLNNECSRTSLIENTWKNEGDNKYSFNNQQSSIEFDSDGSSFRIVNGDIVYKKI